MDYLKNVNYEDFVKDLYFSYDYTNNHLETKYNIDLTKFKDRLEDNIKNNKNAGNLKIGNNILEFNKLDFLIERRSNINLDEYRLKLLEFNENVLP